MTNTLNDGLGKLKETLQSDQFKKILPYLLAGGVGAAGGAYMTGGRKKKKGEGRLGYLGRVLRNATLAGGLAAGAQGLGRYGMKKLNAGVSSVDGKQLPGLDNPTDQLLRSTLFSPATAVGAGGVGLLATHSLPGIGADTKGRDNALETIAKALGTDTESVKGMTPWDLKKEMGNADQTFAKNLTSFDKLKARFHSSVENMAPDGKLPKDPGARPVNPFLNGIKQTANKAGLTVGDKHAPVELGSTLKTLFQNRGAGAGGDLKNLLTRIKPHAGQQLERFSRAGLATMGQTTGRRLGRAGIGLALASLPALAGAFLTDEKPEQQ